MDNRILKSDLIFWKRATWLQDGSLKSLSQENLDQLKQSLLNNGFVAPFHVWQHDHITYILDGCHRQKALMELEAEGYEIPEQLPATFIECKDIEQASELVLIFSAQYAEITQPGIQSHADTFGINLDSLNQMITIPNINLTPKEKYVDIGREDTKPYNLVHVLLSFPPDIFPQIAHHIEELKSIKEVQYEQSAN